MATEQTLQLPTQEAEYDLSNGILTLDTGHPKDQGQGQSYTFRL